MSVYGKINVNDFTIVESKFHKTKLLDEDTAGVSRVLALSSSQDVTDEFNTLNAPTTGSSHWYFGRVNYYSASFGLNQAIDSGLSLFEESPKKIPHKHKYFDTASFFYVPQKYFGEEIKKTSFKLTDLNNPDNAGVNPIIIDDGNGNLYSTNAHHSQSAGALSSSDNYVGNIFYEQGLAVITETGSWSGSVDYSDLATNYTLRFDSHHTITTHEYNVTLLPQDYNLTTNYSIRNVLTTDTEPLKLSTPFVAATFTSSDFQPYITTINLYQDGDYDTPVIQATFPKPIRKSDKINLRFKIKLDI